MNLFATFEARIRDAVTALHREGLLGRDLPDLSRIVVEPPRDPGHGDIASNAAMVLAKDLGLKPGDLARLLAERLRQEGDIQAAEVAGPGFINLRLAPTVWSEVLQAVVADGSAYGRSTMGEGRPVNVEYVSANPTGPMHVGHCRGAVVGDALASLLEAAGFAVTREYYINDAGAQVDVLARSAHLRYREALGEAISIPDGLYPGDYLVQVGQLLAERHGRELLDGPEQRWLPVVREAAIAAMMDLIRADLAALNVRHDVFFSERSLQQPVDRVGATIDTLVQRGDVYLGRLPPPKGQRDEDWEDREQKLFRSTDYGDDIDRPLIKSDDSYTYFANDIAYHKNKVDRGFARMIDIWGADHGGYVKRMQAAVKAISDGQGALDVRLCQLVRLMRAGEPVKMSKRSGSFVTLREVVDEVGRDAVRFMMLMRKSDATLDFDLAKVVEQSKDNPVFYVQYAHARCRSVLRNAAEVIPEVGASGYLSGADPGLLDDGGELALIKRLAQFPRLIEAAAGSEEPHRIAFYLYDLAAEFHGHWNRGKDLPHLRFIRSDAAELSRARLALVQGVVTVIASGLHLLGVSAPEEMR